MGGESKVTSMTHIKQQARVMTTYHHFLLACAAMVLLALISLLVAPARVARAAQEEARPSVLVVDANVGDYDRLVLQWLGEKTSSVGEHKGQALTTTSAPAWWTAGGGSGKAPNTFVLGSNDARGLSADDIVWALDTIRSEGAEPRTLVVSLGLAGLRVREYVEDLASTNQSDRADIVGLAFLGTPHNGYGAMGTYPKLSLWADLADGVGLKASDLEPGSSYLKKLNQESFPKVSKTLAVTGNVGDLGFGLCDGAGTAADLAIGSSVSDQVVPVQAFATISREVNLSGAWMPASSNIDYPGTSVDGNLAERLSAMNCYTSSDEVISRLVEFYQSWYSQGAPVTHNSSVLALDLSGSMLEKTGDGRSKLDGAKDAAQEYLHAMQACTKLPHAAPTDVMTFGFEESLKDVSSGYDDAACKAIDSLDAKAISETNVGIALEEAVLRLKDAPRCARKHITLLSDGASTRGQSNEQMLSGVVSEAKRRGITIDTVGYGDTGESNAAFLKEISKATGGTYYEPCDGYELKVDFLKSYYGSLGLKLVDEELDAGTKTSLSIGKTDGRTSALQIGVVADGSAPQVKLECDGKVVPDSDYTTQQSAGLTSILCENPQPGAYAISVPKKSGRVHAFAVQELGIPSAKPIEGEQVDSGLIMLIILGVCVVVSVVLVIVLSARRR